MQVKKTSLGNFVAQPGFKARERKDRRKGGRKKEEKRRKGAK